MIKVEVCYALMSEQQLVTVSLPEGSSVIRAIMAAGILDRFPDVKLEDSVGIFSNKVSLSHVVSDGDRIEIYRPLIVTPNEARLLRAKKKISVCS